MSLPLTGKGACQRPNSGGKTMRGDGHRVVSFSSRSRVRWSYSNRYGQQKYRIFGCLNRN